MWNKRQIQKNKKQFRHFKTGVRSGLHAKVTLANGHVGYLNVHAKGTKTMTHTICHQFFEQKSLKILYYTLIFINFFPCFLQSAGYRAADCIAFLAVGSRTLWGCGYMVMWLYCDVVRTLVDSGRWSPPGRVSTLGGGWQVGRLRTNIMKPRRQDVKQFCHYISEEQRINYEKSRDQLGNLETWG